MAYDWRAMSYEEKTELVTHWRNKGYTTGQIGDLIKKADRQPEMTATEVRERERLARAEMAEHAQIMQEQISVMTEQKLRDAYARMPAFEQEYIPTPSWGRSPATWTSMGTAPVFTTADDIRREYYADWGKWPDAPKPEPEGDNLDKFPRDVRATHEWPVDGCHIGTKHRQRTDDPGMRSNLSRWG